MRIENHCFKQVITTETEQEALEIVYSMLNSICEDYSEDLELMSCLTREIVQVDELGRVLGILGFFQEPNQIFQVNCQ